VAYQVPEMRVLVVEDERELATLIAEGLRQDGIAADIAFDGADALYRVSVTRYDALVLDRDLPVVHGDDVCRRLGDDPGRPRVLMLTAAGAERDEVHGLSIGADDYLAKPFSFPVLLARLRALARRVDAFRPPVLRRGDLVVDTARRFATRAGAPVDLSRKELAVLEALLVADGAVVSAEQLLERVWDDGIDPFTNAVRVTLMRLRRKLGDPPVILTVAGEGYRIEGERA
jgi:DNA-binding response OmpR family regulator